jgi:hypothetical protein
MKFSRPGSCPFSLVRVAIVFVLLSCAWKPQLVYADAAAQDGCRKSGAVINVAVGWTVEQAERQSVALTKPQTPGLNAGLSSYVYQPALLGYQGEVPMQFRCPRMVSVSQKDGLISGVEVYLDSDNPSSLDKAMDLAASWGKKFDGMNFENLSTEKYENVTTPREVVKFFRLIDSPLSMTAGKVLGVWRKKGERFSVGVERWNIASNFVKPNYIYVAEIVISKYQPSTR